MSKDSRSQLLHTTNQLIAKPFFWKSLLKLCMIMSCAWFGSRHSPYSLILLISRICHSSSRYNFNVVLAENRTQNLTDYKRMRYALCSVTGYFTWLWLSICTGTACISPRRRRYSTVHSWLKNTRLVMIRTYIF